MSRIGPPAENRGFRIFFVGTIPIVPISFLLAEISPKFDNDFVFVVGLGIAIMLVVIVELFLEYRFRRSHTPEERAALAAQLQVRQDRFKFAVGANTGKRKILRTGAEARAVITAADDFGHDDPETNQSLYLELAVTVGDDPPYAVRTGEYLVWGWGRHSLFVGRELVVRVDLTNRQRVAVDWKESVRLCQASDAPRDLGGPAGGKPPQPWNTSPAPLSGTYTYKSSSGKTATWTITPSGPGSVDVASAGGPKAPFYGTAQSSGQTWTMVVHRPDVVKHRRRRGDTGSGTSTFTWDAITLRGKVGVRTDEGVFGRPARQLNTVKFTLTKI